MITKHDYPNTYCEGCGEEAEYGSHIVTEGETIIKKVITLLKMGSTAQTVITARTKVIRSTKVITNAAIAVMSSLR